jgi:Ca2+-transporting ATPase
VLLTEDWIRLGCVGLLMMTGTVGILDAYYPGGLFTLFARGPEPNEYDEAHSRTAAFTTLMMYQLFDVYNCRSRRRSAFLGFLENKWLLVAIAFSLGTHILVIYVPALQTAFHTVPLSLSDWLVTTAVAASLLIAMEIAKIFLRARDKRIRAYDVAMSLRSRKPGALGAG